ncbi:MAG: hypothetical protein CMF58_06190 [Lentimicrobiaceae bacterium]|jgi:uncharacterized membrane protein YqgA involved in biofilm formation|nr:hypothetical protein [Lentimicrobiaceae bacterium]MDG1901254.1 DUF554 domain-containing protein [Bacteroidales bacterium]MDG2080587.1 DUF554 domain-containing protein [Bacteroidales bacterium]|tara:strand:- start:4946 stop:5638 length:693 start_codon:yes stop_codon:yes gene_type:complete
MEGTFVNIIAIIAGTSLGMLLNRRLPERYIKIFFQVIGLFTIFLGISMALETTHILHMVIALITGGILGEYLNIQKRVEFFGEYLKKRFKIGNERFSEGLVTAFLLYCIGSLTIIGAIEAGLTGNQNLILIKSIMDGVSSIALASALGIGVMFSVIPLFIFQGGITLMAMYFGDFFPPIMISEMSAVGGVLLIGLGIDILGIKKMSVLNILPALVMIIILIWLLPDFGMV